jgi:hypothetical protein
MTQEIRRRKKRFQRDRKVKINLTGRDRKILEIVYQQRFLSSMQIILLIQGGRQGVLRRLSLLYHAGFLDRPQRQKTVFGNNYCLIYGLGNKGAAVIASQYGLPVETVDWTRKNREAKELFLEHTLMVSQILTSLQLACRSRKDVTFIEPPLMIKRRHKPPTIASHALSWRVRIKKGEFFQKRPLSFNMIPDSMFGLRVKKGNKSKETYFFLEADRATMPIKRTNFYRSSFYKKMVGYIASHKNRLFSEYFGLKKVRILTVTQSNERINNMIAVNKDLHHSGHGYGLFLFSRIEHIDIEKPDKLFSKIWIDGEGKHHNLLE